MNQNSISRIKCAMIAYELERALGRYVREKGDRSLDTSTAQEILNRSTLSQKANPATIVVENSYLGEILALALALSKTTSDEDHLVAIEKLITALQFFDIRNAVSHPNRPFPECYWYRSATIASDPAIDALSFYEVTLAFQNAEEGKLEEPPEEWLSKRRWSIPTSIPTQFEHSITGLVGRRKETTTLQKEIKSKRSPLISIVARGGIGKTSLALQAISDFCLSNEAASFLDMALWSSLKQERLTTTGIETLTAPSSMAELSSDICIQASEITGLEIANLQQLTETLGDKRVLLCLDNLETILRDSPQQFSDFYESLPENWKVIVTSRIPVDSAKNISLEPLDTQGATNLARNYFVSKGHPSNDGDLLEKIVTACKFNPLAIRLTIDSYLSGKDIVSALERTDRDVVAFSFSNLLETLTDLENKVLEAIFILGSPSRSDICEALSIDSDRVAESIGRLHRASLIARITDEAGEKFELSDSVRDLLRGNPRDILVRENVGKWLQKSKDSVDSAMRLQASRGTSPVDKWYIPNGTASQLIKLSKEIKAAIKREDRQKLVEIESSLRSQIASEPPSSFRYRMAGIIAQELGDNLTATDNFKKAIAADNTDPAPHFCLCSIYQKTDFDSLKDTTDQLISNGWGGLENAGQHYAGRIIGLNLFALNCKEEYNLVFDSTTHWETKLEVLPSLALARASAYKRLADSEHRKKTLTSERAIEILGKAASIMSVLLESVDFAEWIFPELRKLVSEITIYQNNGIFHLGNQTNSKSFGYFQSLNDVCKKNIATRTIIQDSELETIFKGNPFSTDTNELPQNNTTRRDDYTLTRVKRGANPEKRYVFLQDDLGRDFFLHQDQFEGGNWKNWRALTPRTEVAIKFDLSPTGNALKVTQAWLTRN